MSKTTHHGNRAGRGGASCDGAGKPPEPISLDSALHRHGSLSRLARELGISQSHLSDIRHGRKAPSLGLALKIAAATGIPIESLVTDEAGGNAA